MPAPKLNDFWKRRAKHGRDKIFSDPETLLLAAYSYFNWCVKNPLMKTDAIKTGEKAGEIIYIPIQRPFTISGLCIFLNVNTKYFNDFTKNLPEDSVGFSEVITRVKEIIYTQKFEGAAIGNFNPNIIARDLGLTDKADLTSGGEKLEATPLVFISTSEFSADELQAYKDKFLNRDELK